jgi:uncharacterized protein (TIGR00299 family) protein
MKILYFDCQAGIAGDMTLAALLDLGLPLAHLREELAKLSLPASYTLQTAECRRQGVRGIRFDVGVEGDQPHRHYGDIVAMITASTLAEPVRARALRIFARLAEAEATVHGVGVEQVHFHEVGAVDAIIDIVGTAIGLEYLGVSRLFAAPLPLGSGFVETAHGRLPVPAPATAELLSGLRVHNDIGPGERVTPTGAAIVAALAERGPLPELRIERTGSGAGSKDFPDRPNILRAILGSADPAPVDDQVLVVETNLDDCSPEILGHAMERLLAAGALDVWFTPIQMKKNRPAVLLSLLTVASESARLVDIVLTETTAIGVRTYPVRRTVCQRRIEERTTPLGPVRFKVSSHGEKPEFDDCCRIARERGLTLREVYRRLEKESTHL